jgi:hypothetical protein
MVGMVAGDRELQHHAWCSQPLDGLSRGQRILEDLVLLGEDEIGGDQDTPAFVPLREEGKKHPHLSGLLLHIPNVVDGNRLE